MSRHAFHGQWPILNRYYDRKFVEKTLALDDTLVKEYFPVSVVVGSILDIYQDLLNVSFQPIQGETWHPGAYKYPHRSESRRLSFQLQMSSSLRYGRKMRETQRILWGIATSIFSREVCIPILFYF